MNIRELTEDVVCIEAGISNCYLVGNSKRWVLVDAGTGGHADDILKAAAERFGEKSRPRAILLTHGHFDHSGSASELSDYWDVSVFAHHRELPFVDGRSEYPPPDPTVGGFFSFVVRFLPATYNKVNLGDCVEAFGDLRNLPGMNGWEALETPGHTPGHVSFFRRADRALIAGDTFSTVNLDSMFDTLSKKQQVCRPTACYTCDWDAAEQSVRRLAALRPNVLAAGHGVPMAGPEATRALARLARNWPAPTHGRYVPEPARADEDGIVYLPPPVPDPLPKVAAGMGIAAAAGAATIIAICARRYGSARELALRAGLPPGEVA